LASWLVLLLDGAVVGFGIAAPVGPVAMLSIDQTLRHGWRSGFTVGMAAALGDTVYGFCAAFGLAVVADFLMSHEQELRLIGGLFLIAYGGYLLLTKSKPKAPPPNAAGLARLFLSAFVIIITNPITPLAFIAIFTSLGLTEGASSMGAAAILTGGVFIGAAFWWFSLVGGAALMRDRLNHRGLVVVKQISGLVILGFGLYGVVSFLV